jgi:uncharacterized protein YutE (UPF0331/DUF86 family)
MYYVDEEQIRVRLEFVPTVTKVLRSLAAQQDEATLAAHFAAERAVHLAIEVVTDVGSLMIDGFMMRDASGYEDIIEVLKGEGVMPEPLADELKALVAERRSLAQEYMHLDRTGPLRQDLEHIAALLEQFPDYVKAFIDKELQPFR